jgi:diguanylate cyclase (GGDEF)-like protein
MLMILNCLIKVWGRNLGDKLLYTAAQSLKNSIRETDIIGRIGEDEFSIILPGIGYELAHSVICRLKNQLLETMEIHQWSVTFSIAAVTLLILPIQWMKCCNRQTI